MHNIHITNSSSDIDTDIDINLMKRTLNELGIRSSDENECKLILHNDHVNDMMHVVVALSEICQLTPEKCVEIMLEAHEKGKAVIKSGPFDTLNEMKKALNKRNLEATIEEK